MTQVDAAREVGSPYYQFTFLLVGPSTGSNTVADTGGGTFKEGACASYDGVKQTGQPDAQTGTDSGGSAVTSLSNSITTVNANAVIVTTASNNGGNFTSTTNITNLEVYNYNGAGFLMLIGDTLKASPGALSQTVSTGGTNALVGMSQVSLIPVASAAAPTNLIEGLVRAFWFF